MHVRRPYGVKSLREREIQSARIRIIKDAIANGEHSLTPQEERIRVAESIARKKGIPIDPEGPNFSDHHEANYILLRVQRSDLNRR